MISVIYINEIYSALYPSFFTIQLIDKLRVHIMNGWNAKHVPLDVPLAPPIPLHEHFIARAARVVRRRHGRVVVLHVRVAGGPR